MKGLHFSVFSAFCGFLLAAEVSPAQAYEPTSWSCGLVEENTIHIDGLTSDWDGVSPEVLKIDAAAGSPARTLGVKLRCNYDKSSVYLLIDVEDDVVLRSSSGAPNEDHIELGFAVADKKGGTEHVDRLLIYPGSYQQKQKRLVRWQSKKPVKVVEGEGPAGRKRTAKGSAFEVYDALQPRGYAIEMRMPRKLIPGYKEGAPLRLSVRVVDSDAPSGQLAASAALSEFEPAEALSVLELEEGQASIDELLGDLKLGTGDVYFDKTGDIGDGTGRILMIGKFIAFIGKAYAYQEMAPQRADIKDVKLVEIDAKHQAVALRIVEHGSGGGREVERVFMLTAGRFQSIFAAEVSKEQGARKLYTDVSFVKRGATTDIVLTPRPAVGFTAATYNELPAEDVVPILLPWQDKRARFVYKGDRYVKE